MFIMSDFPGDPYNRKGQVLFFRSQGFAASSLGLTLAPSPAPFELGPSDSQGMADSYSWALDQNLHEVAAHDVKWLWWVNFTFFLVLCFCIIISHPASPSRQCLICPLNTNLVSTPSPQHCSFLCLDVSLLRCCIDKYSRRV